MGVDHIEGTVGEPEIEDGSGLEREGVHAGGDRIGPGLGDDRRRGIDADHLTGIEAPGQVAGDGPRPTAHIEQGHARQQVGQEIAGGVVRRPPAVRAQHAVVVPVGVGDVGHPPSMRPAVPIGKQASSTRDISCSNGSTGMAAHLRGRLPRRIGQRRRRPP